MAELEAPVDLNRLTRQTVRLWWADGFWDLAMAGFFALTALWLYPWIKTLAFPSWTWTWPFHTMETVNPLRMRIVLWGLGLLPIWALYAWGAYQLVRALKRRYTTGGAVRHPFVLPVEKWVYLAHALIYLGGFILLSLFFDLVKSGPHLLSACFIMAPAGILYAVGQHYELVRYKAAAIAGVLGGTVLESFTTDAAFMAGPRHLLDVSPHYGNPALPLALWAVIMLVTGLPAVVHAVRCRDGN